MTFNQGAFTKSIQSELPNNNSYHSIDLSSATDRMPIRLQQRIVSFIFDSAEKGQAWHDILVGLPFVISLDKGKTYQEITYGAGQPMGAYSS
jgi:hypothetical protein